MAVARAVAVLAVASTRPSAVLTSGGVQTQRFLKFKALCSSSSKPSSRKLVLYSKPGCCLCDGLKEKLHAAFLLSGPDSLSNVDLQAYLFLLIVNFSLEYEFEVFDLMLALFIYQIRDITSNLEWEKAYQYEIPVLAKVLSDGTEVCHFTPSTSFLCQSLYCFFFLCVILLLWLVVLMLHAIFFIICFDLWSLFIAYGVWLCYGIMVP